ncbi:MAG: glycosyltransferase family 4 protein [Pedobacter sp.]|uniref:glycosyltransferase family 4 protein n=1 Tax=Pedobacter sp. TaxID=1411316 RepID=UPI002807C36E|nr:glycosyltransferase family 4 protein [Pedobacter sp.]MDQ8004885.1 glycosyltransferase family 4 protein [Pedobacter sp.]
MKKTKIFAIVPSGFCFGLQFITIDFFRNFTKIDSLFLLTKWSDGMFKKSLNENSIPYTESWLGFISKSLKTEYVKMTIHGTSKLPLLYYHFLRTYYRFKPEALYFANRQELILLYPVLKLFAKVPVLCHLHDPPPPTPFQKRSFRFYDKLVTHYISISDDVRDRALMLGMNASKITTIHNGIEIKQTDYENLIFREKWSEESIIIGITGQMTETKGHLDLLEAFILARKIDQRLKLLIGSKPIEPLYTKLKKRIAEENIADFVQFTGWLDESKTFYDNIDMLVLASRHDEGFGLVVAEAMSYRKVVIATKSGGAKEIIINKESGFLIEKGDISALKDCILHASENNMDLVRNNAYNRIDNHFNISIQSKKLEDFIIKFANKC